MVILSWGSRINHTLPQVATHGVAAVVPRAVHPPGKVRSMLPIRLIAVALDILAAAGSAGAPTAQRTPRHRPILSVPAARAQRRHLENHPELTVDPCDRDEEKRRTPRSPTARLAGCLRFPCGAARLAAPGPAARAWGCDNRDALRLGETLATSILADPLLGRARAVRCGSRTCFLWEAAPGCRLPSFQQHLMQRIARHGKRAS